MSPGKRSKVTSRRGLHQRCFLYLLKRSWQESTLQRLKNQCRQCWRHLRTPPDLGIQKTPLEQQKFSSKLTHFSQNSSVSLAFECREISRCRLSKRVFTLLLFAKVDMKDKKRSLRVAIPKHLSKWMFYDNYQNVNDSEWLNLITQSLSPTPARPDCTGRLGVDKSHVGQAERTNLITQQQSAR